jgi:two-component system copper resistance phosphate regulon response regulator CusR
MEAEGRRAAEWRPHDRDAHEQLVFARDAGQWAATPVMSVSRDRRAGGPVASSLNLFPRHARHDRLGRSADSPPRHHRSGQLMRALVVEDDADLSRAITRGLRDSGIDVVSARSFAEARDSVMFATHDVIVLDVMLPGGTGFELCELLRARGITTPVLMLTARDAVEDRVRGLTAGADDYLIKPFAFAELVARLRALARRAPTILPQRVSVADLDVDLTTRAVTRAGRRLELTAKEFALLELFVRNVGVVLERSTITERVWDANHDPFANALEALVRRLRAKVDDDFPVKLIHTMRGAGYRFAADS